MRKRLQTLAAAAVLFAQALPAEILSGRVVAVVDGDTVRILTADQTEERVRLATIDAPERGQPYGTVSRQNLADALHLQSVDVDWSKRDRWGRIVGRVLIDGRDAGLIQIRAGLAWHYTAYADEQSATDRAIYAEGESQARAAESGLWSDPDPIPPWEWRRK